MTSILFLMRKSVPKVSQHDKLHIFNTIAALQWKVTTMQQETRPYYASGFSLSCYDQSYTHCFHEGTGKEPWATKAVT